MIYFDLVNKTNVKVLFARPDKVHCQCLKTGLFLWRKPCELSYKRPDNSPYWMQGVIC